MYPGLYDADAAGLALRCSHQPELSVADQGSALRFSPPRLSPGVRLIMAVHIVAFVALYIVPALFGFTAEQAVLLLSLNPIALLDGYVWQLVTGVLFYNPADVLGLFFDLLWLYFLGTQVEAMVGRRKLLEYYGWCALAGVLATVVIGLPAQLLAPGAAISLGLPSMGAGGAVLGLIFVWVGRLDRQIVHMWLLGPMQARTIGIILLAFWLLSILNGHGGGALAHLAGMGAGYAIGRGLWPPDRSQARLKREKARIQRELRRFEVIEGGRAGEPKAPDERPRGWTGLGGGQGGDTFH